MLLTLWFSFIRYSLKPIHISNVGCCCCCFFDLTEFGKVWLSSPVCPIFLFLGMWVIFVIFSTVCLFFDKFGKLMSLFFVKSRYSDAPAGIWTRDRRLERAKCLTGLCSYCWRFYTTGASICVFWGYYKILSYFFYTAFFKMFFY